MISLCYLLIFLIKGTAKWVRQPFEQDKKALFKSVGKLKNNLKPKHLCTGSALELLPFCEDIFSIKFEKEPNYGKLRHMLVTILLKEQLVPNLLFDWSTFNLSQF